MSFKRKVAAAAATLTLVGGVGMAGALSAGSASAATPSCGSRCIDVFSKQFGTHAHPNYVVRIVSDEGEIGTGRFPFEQWDFSANKNFRIRESLQLQFRSEFFNIWNHANFANPSFLDVESIGTTNSPFGKITSTVGTPRLIQFSLRYSF